MMNTEKSELDKTLEYLCGKKDALESVRKWLRGEDKEDSYEGM